MIVSTLLAKTEVAVWTVLTVTRVIVVLVLQAVHVKQVSRTYNCVILPECILAITT